ncbi:hypothetical protein GUITHDRAFT_109957 [Guillardia theta CCMP2712]|uniref:Uncharacterized protein n=1 Tax=Guillardia theta (strain CCMP2712) TaxID=905079 RepID=L1J6K4_GUITC|nr:hypothetical protein GUITHDRAFT_109957 [Guillardia theta CCMP2712]EKX44173.1 hypothetical protein GUITHDRAFT_109957 [Guillardia theta CCMP2712]|eukprot:XP_005831153.1 hypothetical protein GUITHDRAFT_109957 [Guillardia theta CCMP2712]
MASGLTVMVLVIAAVMMAKMVNMSRSMMPSVLSSKGDAQKRTALASRFSDAVEAAKVLQQKNALVSRHRRGLAVRGDANDRAPQAQPQPSSTQHVTSPPSFVPGKHIVDIDAGELVAGTDVTFHDFNARGAVGQPTAPSAREQSNDRRMIGTDATFHDFNARRGGEASTAAAGPSKGYRSHRVTEAHRRHRTAQKSLDATDKRPQSMDAPQTINVASGLGGGVPSSMWVTHRRAQQVKQEGSRVAQKSRRPQDARGTRVGSKAESQPAQRRLTMRDMEDNVGTNIVFHGVVNEVREGKGGGYAMPTVGQGGILGARRRGIRFNDREMY